MRILIAIHLLFICVASFGCDGGECGQAGPDECWPGPGKCWLSGDPEGHREGVCCDDACDCALAEKWGPVQPIMVAVPADYGCAAGLEYGGFDCDEECNCTYPKDGDGVIIELPR
jgi:hypothetical protein